MTPQSEPPRGSTSDERLGESGVDGQTPPAHPSAEPPRALRVLVVDDDRVDRMALTRALSRTGLDLTLDEADSVMAAIELLATEPFDCVFLDYNLPDGDGLTFLRGLRRAGISTSVLMITGQEDAEVAGELIKAGAVDYIPKALLTMDRLARSLERVFGSR